MDIAGLIYSLFKPAAPAGSVNLPVQVDVNGPNTTVSISAPLATASAVGLAKPDGTSITVDGTGTLSAVVGGAAAKTASYTAVAGDNGTLLSFNSASAVTLTLPATAPSATWRIAVQNIGAGALTINPNGKNLDGAAGSLVLAQNSGVLVYTDGTNYFTERGVAGGASIAGVQQESYTYAADTGAANAYAVTLSPAPTIVAGLAVQVKIANANTAASTLAVNGGTAISIKKQGSAALASGDWTAGQIVEVIFDGTNWQWIGGSGGVGSSTYFGQGDAVAGGGENQITLGSTPLANSTSVFVAGAMLRPSTAYTISGTTIALAAALASAAVVVVNWATANSTPGGIALNSTNPVLRATSSQLITSGTLNVTLPTGSVAGDMCVIFIGNGNNLTTGPSGWTVADNHSSSVSYYGGSVRYKVLTSGDITSGTVPFVFSGPVGVAIAATFIGATGGVRETDVSQNGFTAPASVVGPTTGTLAATDMVLYFGTNHANGTDTVSRGTMKQQLTDGTGAAGCLYAEAMTTSTTLTPTFNYPGTYSPNGYYQAIIVFKV